VSAFFASDYSFALARPNRNDYATGKVSPRKSQKSPFHDRRQTTGEILESNPSDLLKKSDTGKVYMKSIEEMVPYNQMARQNLQLDRYMKQDRPSGFCT